MKIATITNATPGTNIYANPIYFWLRSFLDCAHSTNTVEWVYNSWAWLDVDKVVDECLRADPDIILLSVFIYNQGETEALIHSIRQASSTVKIVLGGPQVDGREPLANFITWPEVNAVVYGDGEEAILGLVQRWEQTGELSAGINCAVPGDKGTYKRFRWEEWPAYSCFTGALNTEWRTASSEILKLYGSNEAGRISVQWPSETDRGCPYACTFCDWSAGLHHKLTIRPLEAIYADIDAFVGTDDIIFFNNANFFQLKRDLEIVDRLNQLGVIYKITSTSKLQKERVYQYFIDNEQRIQEMYDSKHLAGTNGIGRIALQSIKLDTLQAINRPEIAWTDHKRYLQEYRAVRRHNLEVAAEIINDLPLMTDLDYLWQCLELQEAGIDTIIFQNWEFLPNSPANDAAYLNQWNLTVVDQITVGSLNCIPGTRLPDLNQVDYKTNYQSKIVVDRTRGHPNTFAHVTSQLVNWCYKHKKDLKKEISTKLDFMIGLSQVIDKQLKKLMIEHEQVIWGLYNPLTKQYCDVDKWIQQYFTLSANTVQKHQAVHPQKDEMHQMVKKYITYHQLPHQLEKAS